MAPIQQNINGASNYGNNSAANAKHMTSSSKIQSNNKSSSSSISSNNSSFSDSRKSSLDGKASSKNWLEGVQESLLPIATRGLFYNDSFFEDARKNYDKAVKEVLDQWGQRLEQTDDLTSYRKLREVNLQEGNQAVSVSEDETNHKVVLDVKDFMKGDVKVKMIDENELVVEGTFEKQDGGCVSKKSFQRSFTFPGLVKGNGVSSAMSSDGVLTVTVPKAKQQGQSSKNITNQARLNNNSVHTSSISNSQKVSSQDTRIRNTDQDFLLPIARKGNFFQDSFFESTRQDFEKSVQEVLNKWGDSKTLDTRDNMASYRNIREKNMKHENQAVSFTQEDDHYKVILDVKDFMDGEVTAKIVEENELRVEGNTKSKNGGASSNMSFYRTFTFPRLIKSDSITSAMSSDGILTVLVPKQEETTAIETESVSNSVQSTKGNHSSKVTNATTESLGSISNSNQTKNFHINHDIDSFSPESLLPVSHKGLFFHDDFFASARENFEKAVQEVLSKSEKTESISDHMDSYRTLRETDLKEENQAVSVTEDHQNHKVVMDVRDFVGNDLKVKVVDENELVVEGVVEKKEGGSVSKKSFQRRFVFPGLVNSDAIKSTMSSDGVLIITVPKNLKTHNSSRNIHIENNNTDNTASKTRNLSSDNSNSQFSSNTLHQTGVNNFGFQDSSLGLDHHYRNNVLENMSSDDFSLSGMDSNIHEEFFAKAHRDFEAASRRMFNQSHELMSSADEQTLFHNTQQIDTKDKDQELSMSEDAHCHKVEIDLKDFAGGDLQVKALEHNELLVEGNLKMEEGGKSSNKSFSRRVQLPGLIKVDEITSILSKNGVLTIKAPKDFRKSGDSHHFAFTR